MSKHSQEAWTSIYSPGGWLVDGSESTNRVGVKDSNGKTVCTMRPCVSDLSNARLIAAAPDLLAALETLANVAEDLAGSDSDMPSHRRTLTEFDAAVYAARAAIAKARI